MSTGGVFIETGSWGRDYPHSVNPRLYADPDLYYAREILPLIEANSVTRVLWHRPLGEVVIGDLGMDFDTLTHHFQEPSGNRFFAMRMVAVLADLAQRVDLTIYKGAIWQDRMKGLLGEGRLDEWSRRFEFEIAPFPNARFALDGTTYADKMGPNERLAVRMLEARMPGRVMIEALPDDDIPELHGMDACVFENLWGWQGVRAKNCRSVTRILTTHLDGQGQPVPFASDPEGFAADCAKNGHRWLVSTEVMARTGKPFRAIQAAANEIANDKSEPTRETM
jgi:hypothetical protein